MHMKDRSISTDNVWVVVCTDPRPSMYSHDTCKPTQIYLDRTHAEAACKQLNKHDRQDWQKEFKWQVFSLADRIDTIMDAQYDAAQYSDVD
jgi:hypothetical protein